MVAVADVAVGGVDAEYRRRKRAEKHERGECANCKALRLPGLSMCEKHMILVRARNRARMEARRQAGKCTICGDPVKGRRWRCEVCQRMHNVRQQQIREQLQAAGMCPYCRKRPRPTKFRHCAVCRRYMAAFVQRKRVGKRRKLEFRRLFYDSPGAVSERFHKLMQGRSSE